MFLVEGLEGQLNSLKSANDRFEVQWNPIVIQAVIFFISLHYPSKLTYGVIMGLASYQFVRVYVRS